MFASERTHNFAYANNGPGRCRFCVMPNVRDSKKDQAIVEIVGLRFIQSFNFWMLFSLLVLVKISYEIWRCCCFGETVCVFVVVEK